MLTFIRIATLSIILNMVATPAVRAATEDGSGSEAYRVVKTYFDAWTSKNIDLAMSQIADDVEVNGPASPPISGAANFRPALEQFASITKDGSAKLLQLIADGDRASILYQIELPPPVGVLKIGSFFRVENGKIKTYEIVFDATDFRKLFEKKD